MRFLHRLTSLVTMTLLLSTTCSSADDEHHKRAPSGFTGVRGKKSIPDEAYNSSDDVESSNSIQNQQQTDFVPSTETEPPSSYVIEKRAPSGFFGMRGKKPLNSPYYWYNYPEEMYKRAPMGFVGMRGKKETLDENDYSYYDEPSKRAQMGFFGMRGKKYLIQPVYQGDKRASMGFVGMRGKKDFENSQGYFEDTKRAPSGFFGMRGKKQPSGFFGMRGKKFPYEFRGKFVGVRGKKSSDITIPNEYYPDSNLARLSDDLDINQLMLLLTQQNEYSQ
ncbi:unnamed protein product [Ceutorhynchus assimilis]|uniref:Tachykinin n=1 Tax=Ceutorhynchus assimilis TaxID=467358 RepID=A0A9N9MXR4_9CUCU|nr:unnamed protein product [Ceutorhynchus assimilis]